QFSPDCRFGVVAVDLGDWYRAVVDQVVHASILNVNEGNQPVYRVGPSMVMRVILPESQSTQQSLSFFVFVLKNAGREGSYAHLRRRQPTGSQGELPLSVLGQNFLNDFELFYQNGELAIDCGAKFALVQNVSRGQRQLDVLGKRLCGVPQHDTYVAVDACPALRGEGGFRRFDQSKVGKAGGVRHQSRVGKYATSCGDLLGIELFQGVLLHCSQGGRSESHGTS